MTTARSHLTLARPWLLLLSVTVWPCLIVLFHGILPWVVSSLARRVGWTRQHPGWWNWLGIVPIAMGAMVALWFWIVHVQRSAAPKRIEMKWTPDYLLTDGPYRYSRNPMYLAVLAIWTGWAVFRGSWLVLMNFLIIPREERGLEVRHQKHYRRYARSVPRWLQTSKHLENPIP